MGAERRNGRTATRLRRLRRKQRHSGTRSSGRHTIAILAGERVAEATHNRCALDAAVLN